MDIENQVKKVIAEQLGLVIEAVLPEKHLVNDLGADSLDEIELVMALEYEFGIDIPDDYAEPAKTVQQAIDYIKAVKT